MTVPTCLADDVRELPGFLDAAACAGLIARADAHGFHAATITSETGTAVHADIRNNDRVILDDPALAGRLWRRLSAAALPRWRGHRAVGLNTRLRVYRYDPGQTFDWHQDGPYETDDGTVSAFTMMVYLNEGFEGGATSFADVFWHDRFADFAITPRTGKALIFCHPLSHRGDAVVRGRKYVLRTDVMYPATAPGALRAEG